MSIGGGEPFARDDLEELVQGFIDEGLNTRVLTNGIGIPKSRIDRMIDGGLKTSLFRWTLFILSGLTTSVSTKAAGMRALTP